ncbi:hypothetical protein DIJ64_11035 [Mycobacterium leprae]|uniref:Uncharacterized protein n=1 Tax=Mycobacterium leprae TaxID=1769 RepID=A0AAD0KV21_MYCLR|nr:hypothetical protein DIJ64_11035 [Mycobacterium leprae]
MGTVFTWPSRLLDPASSKLPGADALIYLGGDTALMLDEIEEFITGVRGGFEVERVLSTIVFTDIVGVTERAMLLGDKSVARPAGQPQHPWCDTNRSGSAVTKSTPPATEATDVLRGSLVPVPRSPEQTKS